MRRTHRFRCHFFRSRSGEYPRGFPGAGLRFVPIELVRWFIVFIIGVTFAPPIFGLSAFSQEDISEPAIAKVSVTGPREAIRGGNEYSLVIHFVDKNGSHLTADLDREIFVTVDHGEISPMSSMIPQGEGHVEVMYRSPGTVGEATVKAESSGLEVGTWKIMVVTPTYMLLLAAGFGGILGGLVRLYQAGVRRIRARIVKGKLELGLLGRGLFSSVFGVMLFLAVKFGVVLVFDFFEQSGGFYAGTKTFALFMGILGGFGGAHILELLLARIIPDEN